MTPCPDGWRAAADDADPDLVVCDPWPEGGRLTCADYEAHFPGEPGCARIGRPCPAGDFPEELPAGVPVVHVRSGAVAGDGSAATPYGSIRDAIAAAPDGAVVALAKGTYDEAVTVGHGLQLRGACAAETIVASSIPSAIAATVTLRDGGRAEDLTISGARAGVIGMGVGTLESVIVEDAVGTGLRVNGTGSIAAHSVVIRRVRTEGGIFGYGVEAYLGGSVELSRAVVESSEGAGIVVTDAGSQVIATDVAVLDHGSYGVAAQVSARAQLVRAAIERNENVGVFVTEAATLIATDVVVRDQTGSSVGYGMEIQIGSQGTLSRVTLDRSRGAGLLVLDADTHVDVADLVVRDTRGGGDDGYGLGIDVGREAQADIARAWVADNLSAGVVALDVGTQIRITDLVVRRTRSGEVDGTRGHGLQVQDGARVEILRAEIDDSRGEGVFATGLEATAVLTDVVVAGTRQTDCGERGTCNGFGTGVAAVETAHIEATRFRISDNALCGVQLATGAVLDLSDGEVARNAIGANVQSKGFDIERLRDGVLFVDNDVTLDATVLPVPDRIDPI